MQLTGLLPLIRQAPAYQRLRDGRAPAADVTDLGVLEEAKPALIAALAQETAVPILVLTARAGSATQLIDQLQTWLGEDGHILAFPEPDSLPYERLNPDGRIVQERLRTLHELSQGSADRPPVIVAGADAAATRTIAPEAFRRAVITLRQGDRLFWDKLAPQLLRQGYELTTTVAEPGQMARRGGIIDCFPPHLDQPVRIELFGDEIDNIRFFDLESQRSSSLTDYVTILPAWELLLPPLVQAPASLDLAALGPDRGRLFTDELARLQEGATTPTPWFYAPLFNHASLLDYLPADALVVLDEPREMKYALEEYHRQAEQQRQELMSQGELPPDFPLPYESPDAFVRAVAARHPVAFHRWGDPNRRGEGDGDEDEAPQDFAPLPGYAGRLRGFMGDLRRSWRAGERVVLLSLQSQRLVDLLAEEGIVAQPVDDVLAPPEPGSVTMLHGSLPGGWALQGADDEDEGASLRLFTDAELFGFVKERRRRIAARKSRREHVLLSLSPGDHVVHIEHGIARFVATVTMEEQPGLTREYLHLQYAEGARLYVPTEQIDRVARYIGPSDHAPVLSRLGAQEWERAKERVRKAAVDAAKEQLETTVARQVQLGHAFGEDTVWQQELEASFPYVETPDQLDALHEVKIDLQQERPMDRLVCGDVGYGKTEVAVRAAFKVVQEGMQVAVLAPTTVLAQQHYQTFTQRMGAFPVKVEVLSRFRSEREQAAVLHGLADGSVDVVIGTHRLLQRDVSFKRLGLAVVDEEQRFGVLHKEFFKRMRNQVDVLTLTATPIPRTLYMAMVGVRDMSLMETPPEERLAIKTYVMEFDEATIRQAVLRELERGGQIFFVHNRVQTISYLAKELGRIVPEASMAVAHGQMPEEHLERVMVDFGAGEYDVLICTTIIESGLDMPNVNTIIINDADKLGLAQLYQLRGRVGRGSSRAYAYLLYTRNKALTEKAQKRLQAVFEATDLGAGYFIAMKDLEIRGAGNLLGVEQSGHVSAVGFDLYCRMLTAAVEDAKAEAQGLPAPSQQPRPPQVTVDLGQPAYLPDDYVPELEARLDLYRRLALAQEVDDLDDVAEELHDRFGPYDGGPVANLLFAARVRVLATQAGMAAVTRLDDRLTLRLLDGLRVNHEALHGVKEAQPGQNQVRVQLPGRPQRWQPIVKDVLTRLRR